MYSRTGRRRDVDHVLRSLGGRASVGAYPRSKTLAERDAWELTRAWRGVLTLTTILPGMVQGPALKPDVLGSLELLVRMLRGKVPLMPRVSFAPVDTRRGGPARPGVKIPVEASARSRLRNSAWRISPGRKRPCEGQGLRHPAYVVRRAPTRPCSLKSVPKCSKAPPR